MQVQGLIIAVMYEKALGATSAWAPYLAFLPADMSHMPLYWSDEELEQLRGTAAHDKMVGRVQHPADAPTRVRLLQPAL
jgi:SET domain-containing protein 6